MRTSFLALVWRTSKVYWAGDQFHRWGGVLRLICFFTSIALLIYSGVFGYAGLVLIRISKARAAYVKYSVEANPSTNTLYVSGLIGPALSRNIIIIGRRKGSI